MNKNIKNNSEDINLKNNFNNYNKHIKYLINRTKMEYYRKKYIQLILKAYN